MDELQMLAAIAVSAAAGFVGATVKHNRNLRRFRQQIFAASMESVSSLISASLDTMTEDYKLDREEAKVKLFTRCATFGMHLMRVNPATGVAAPVLEKK